MYCSSFNPDSSENVAYNNPLFPVYLRHGRLSSYLDYAAISHWHEDVEFILILSGTMTYNINGTLIELTSGNGILVNSRQLHYGFSSSCSECEFLCILIHPTLFHVNDWFYNTYMEPFLTSTTYPFLSLHTNIDWMKQVLQIIEKLSESPVLQLQTTEYTQKGASYFELMQQLFSLFALLFEHISIESQPNQERSGELRTLKQMLTYITTHYSHKITLDHISAAGTCCKSKCAVLFKKYLHETPMTYTIKYRLRKSLGHLVNSNESISEIAFLNGFCSSSYYCETFRKYYKISPSRYRELHQKDSL